MSTFLFFKKKDFIKAFVFGRVNCYAQEVHNYQGTVLVALAYPNFKITAVSQLSGPHIIITFTF